MPVGFNSPARNLFLLGSSGQQVVTNFFETIDKSSTTDGVFIPDEIRYIATNKKYALAGSAADSNSKSFGWLERQDYNLETGGLTTDYSNRIESTQAGVNTTLRAMELDINDNLIVVGKTGTVPWIAKYSNDGVLDWSSTTNSADVAYLDVASDSNGKYYACGRTPLTATGATDTQAFVESFDANGNPGWGKQAYMLGREVTARAIDANDRGHVVAAGFLEDDTRDKGYIVKINTATGDVMWDRTLTNPDGDMRCTDVFIDSKDQIYVIGNDTTHGYLLKYSAEGNMIWQKKTNQSSGSLLNLRVQSDGETEQTIVFGRYEINGDQSGILSKYAKDGRLVFRRMLTSSNNNSDTFSSLCLDADPSFYYFMYTDQAFDGLAGTPDRYTFGKVSSSGNGLGAFQYTEGTGTTIDYEILNEGDVIGRLSDGSVRNDTSDLIAYPFNANKLLFDDLATQVTNKRRQMDSADSFEYSGSPAIRAADFKELDIGGESFDTTELVDGPPTGQTEYTTPGVYNWQCPEGVTSVCAVAIGSGGGGNHGQSNYYTGGGAGGLGWRNNITVVPGQFYNVVVGQGGAGSGSSGPGSTGPGGNGQDSYFINPTTTVKGGRGLGANPNGGAGGNYTGDGGGNGGPGGNVIDINPVGFVVGGGGGAGGYTGDGGKGGVNTSNPTENPSGDGAGGGAGGGIQWAGGGVGIYGSGPNGSGVSGNAGLGGGGSGGTTGTSLDGGTYGGGGAYRGPGGDGAVRIIWGQGRAFPNTLTADQPAGPGAPTLQPVTKVRDKSGKGNHSKVNGATLHSDGYWEFNGTTDTIETGVSAESLRDIPFTIEAWINITNYNNSEPKIFSAYRSSGNLNWGLYVNTSAQLRKLGSGGDQNGNYGTITQGQWHHIVMIHRNGSGGANALSSFDIYLDSVLKAQNVADDYDAANAFGNVIIGDTFPGKIGEVRIYKRELTADQIFQNYNAAKSKYINEAPEVAPKIGPGIVYDNNLLLNYDFGNRATYDRAENLVAYSESVLDTWDGVFTTGLLDLIDLTGTDKTATTPVGTNNAGTLSVDSVGGRASVVLPSTIGGTKNQQITYSAYLKAKDSTTCRIDLVNATNGSTDYGYRAHATFDLAAGTVGSVTEESDNGNTDTPSGSTAAIEDVGGGWYRCSLTFTSYNGSNALNATLGELRPNSGGSTGSVYAWGLQMERADLPGRYIRTYGSAITAPTKVKNLSNTNFPGSITSATFNSAGHFEFNGTNSEIITDDSISQANLPLTYECWVRTANGYSPSAYVSLMSTYDPDPEGFWILLNPTNTYVTAGNSGSTFHVSSTAVNDGNWHHVAATLDIPNVRIYVDGVDVGGLNNAPNNIIPSTRVVRIGSQSISGTSTRFLDGDIGEARIYNRALSATEVSQNYNATRGKYGV